MEFKNQSFNKSITVNSDYKTVFQFDVLVLKTYSGPLVLMYLFFSKYGFYYLVCIPAWIICLIHIKEIKNIFMVASITCKTMKKHVQESPRVPLIGN